MNLAQHHRTLIVPIAFALSFVAISGLHSTKATADEKDARSWPDSHWQRATPAEAGLDAGLLERAKAYALTGKGAGYIVRGGKLVMDWGDTEQRYDVKSTSKSIGITALGLAILDGKMSLSDKARQHHPTLGVPPQENEASGWLDEITIKHLATQTAGFEKPGGYTKLIFKPGTNWAYSDGGPNWLAECVTLVYKQDLDTLMFNRVFNPIGIRRSDLVWRKNSYREKEIEGVGRREFGSGFSGNVNALARIGLLYLRGGEWQGRQILAASFVKQVGTTSPEVVGLPEVDVQAYGNASDHYGLLWWNNADGTLRDVPRDAYWSWGLYDSLIVVIPSLDIVVARVGESWKREGTGHYGVLKPFLNPIALAAKQSKGDTQEDLLERKLPGKTSDESQPNSDSSSREPARPFQSPYGPSPIFRGIQWSPAESITRHARGSDNWPMTWGDDNQLYALYGDGKGVEPLIDHKLSMGLVRLSGGPGNFVATNVRSPTLEMLGDGAKGKKGSGLLMVDGTLYLLARNSGNSQLAWSSDHGATWTWSDWKFSESFGCPTFLNFGQNYAGARDDFVYIYSHDSDSAYIAADRMVLARVPKNRLRQRDAYEFFSGSNSDRTPNWSADISARAAVFSNDSQCYRSGISYNAPLKRYLWCQTVPGHDPRFEGGLSIYDAPEPWGPWTTVFTTAKWDVGPGESSHFPTKWMSDDGRAVYLVFSGDDSLSVRQGELLTHESK